MASMLLSSSLLFSLSSIFKSPRLNSCSFRSSSFTSTFKSPNFNLCCAISTAPGPWLMLPPTLESSTNTVYNFYSLPQNKILNFNNSRSAPIITPKQIVGTSHGWVAQFTRSASDLYLLNPITGRRVNLPPIHTLPIHDYGCVSKLIMSCDDPESEDCRVIIILNGYESEGLAFCCPSLSTEWTLIGDLKRDYEDVVFSNKLLFCLGYETEELECWDVGDLHSPKLHWSNKNDLLFWYNKAVESLNGSSGLKCFSFRYLVAAPDHQLFLVTRYLARGPGTDLCFSGYPHKSFAFDVHKIDRDENGGGKLSYVEGTGLDGLAIFVGLNHSFAVSASDHQLKPNSIYFTDYIPTLPYYKDEGNDIGIFDYETRTVSSCYYQCEPESSSKNIVPGPVWFTPTQSQ